MKYVYVCDNLSDSKIPEGATVLSLKDYFCTFQPDHEEETLVTFIPPKSQIVPETLSFSDYEGLDEGDVLTSQGHK